jgi:hypothetical protein
MLGVWLGVAGMVSSAIAWAGESEGCEERHPMGDAWWTGPMLANTPATAPRGHFLIEPYLFDATTQGSFDAHGKRKSAARANQYGSLTYIVYGLTDKTGIGLIPTFAYNQLSNAPGSAGVGVGDITVQAQRRLTQFQPCGWIPTISANVQQTLPTGAYDRLGTRPGDGLGAGAFTTSFALFEQMYFWFPNRRIFRTRVNVSDSVSSKVDVKDVSVYGTQAGFRGTASPGRTLSVDLSWEYSATRRWVAALDTTYRHTANTRVIGTEPAGDLPGTIPVVANSGPSKAYGLAPAVEYSWKPYLGVLVGVRIIPAGRNTSETITPAIAINIVH